MKQFTSVFALICAFSSSAHAFWDVQKSEKDVFGNVNVTATSYGDNGNTIRFECGSSSVPYFVFLIRNSSKVIDRQKKVAKRVDKFRKTGKGIRQRQLTSGNPIKSEKNKEVLISRNILKAQNILTNVCKGVFPGEYSIQ